ncbi:MAG TPA: porphobilinogen synthase [Actinobacteria bacterium]|nr:porphobilinogen synthase [Actinomycetota bacterium]
MEASLRFPQYRPRRLRQNELIRSLVSETSLSVDDFVYPLFVKPGKKKRDEVSSMPGVYQLSIDELVKEAKEVASLGIKAVILFGIPKKKDEAATEAYDESGIVQEAIRAIKADVKDLLVMTDVCLCEFTSHGHCGVVKDGEVLNDMTLELLAQMAVSHAEAGADIVAPSDMMDGRVAAIRQSLDQNRFENTPIMAYSAKYSSAYFGPFREAAHSTPQFGDRKTYQMDPANAIEALREVALDIEEGADMVMVKPALAYLDIVRMVKDEFGYPTGAYNVSGEYAMVKAAAKAKMIDEKNVVLETLMSMKRAGADMILTYHAKDAAKWLKDKK